MSLELILVIAFFFLRPPVVSALWPWLRKQMEEMERLAAAVGERPRDDAPRAVPVARPTRRPAPASPAQETHPRPLPPPAAVRRPRLRSRSGLSRAIVSMTVLGPCRAVDPD
jgi:hypothetical protein